MGPLIAKYALLFLGQIIDGIGVIVHATADKAPAAAAPSDPVVLQVLGWVAGFVVTFIGGRLLHKTPPPKKKEDDELVPTITEAEEPTPASRARGQAAGEAAARASAATTAGRLKP